MGMTMNTEALRAYLQLASGLTEVTAQKARSAARSLINAVGPDAVEAAGPIGRQAQVLAEELIASAKSNREHLRALVRSEVERAFGALGVARQDEVAALNERVDRLVATWQRTEAARARRPAAKPKADKPARPKVNDV